MPNTLRFGAYEVNLPAGQLYKHGIKVGLRDQSFQVLAALLEHPEKSSPRRVAQAALVRRGFR